MFAPFSPTESRARVVYLPNNEDFLAAAYFFRIPPEGAFGVPASAIESMVIERAASWARAFDGRLAVAGDHLRSIINDYRAKNATQRRPH